MERVICIVVGYAFGLIETGYIYGRFKKTDIREHGSGNAGTTNALRTFGAKGGAITFMGDLLKAVVACGLIGIIFHNMGIEPVKLYMMYTGAGVILGHNFPFYLRFKGGKGIASSAGVLLVVNPLAALCGILVFIIAVAASKYVSLGSILGSLVLPIAFYITGELGILGVEGQPRIEMYILMVFLALLALFQHRSNIVRLAKGNENKLSFHKKPEVNE